MNYPQVTRLPCPDCGRSFKKAIGLDEHRRVVHNALTQPRPEAWSPPVKRRPSLAETDSTCIECGGEGKLVGGQRIYPHRPDLFRKHFYLCDCGAYCGCHPGSVVPLGNPCGAATRRARQCAHDVIDPLWRSGNMNRHEVYSWLAKATQTPPEKCHIGMMTAQQAWRVVDLVEKTDFAVAEDRREETATPNQLPLQEVRT